VVLRNEKDRKNEPLRCVRSRNSFYRAQPMSMQSGKSMPNTLLTTLLALFLAGPVWPQESESGSMSGEPPESEVAATGSEAADAEVSTGPEQTAEADEIDDSDLDEQTYEEDEDDFIPTEEIPVDQPIPFPSNI